MLIEFGNGGGIVEVFNSKRSMNFRVMRHSWMSTRQLPPFKTGNSNVVAATFACPFYASANPSIGEINPGLFR
jgi:hypothetical protein